MLNTIICYTVLSAVVSREYFVVEGQSAVVHGREISNFFITVVSSEYFVVEGQVIILIFFIFLCKRILIIIIKF